MAFLRLIRQTFFVIIVFQLSIGTTFAASSDGGNGSGSDLGKIATALYSDAGERSNALKMMEAANQLENGEFFKQDPKNFDIFRLVDQKVELYEKGAVAASFSLNNARIEKPTISFTNLKPRYNMKTRELVFEATRGDRVDGTGGTIIARHIIPDMDIVAMAYDRELLTFIDSKGNISAIHMGQVISQAFTSPILVSQNLWSPKRDLNLSTKTVRMDFVNTGVTPYSANADVSEAVLPLDKNGNVLIEAGNLLVRYKDGNKEKVLGLFSRNVTKKLIQENIAWAMKLRFNITPDKEIAQIFLDQESRLEELTNKKADSMMTAEEFLSPFRGLDINQLRTLKHGLDLLDDQDIRTDKFTHDEWLKRHAKLQATIKDPVKLEEIAKRVQHLQEKTPGDDYKKIYREAYTQFLADAEARQRLSEGDNLSKAWQVLNDPAPRENPFTKHEETSKPVKSKKVRSDRAGEWKFVGTVTMALAAYLSAGAIMGGMETLHQVQALSWIYEHMYFDVLKDTAYRFPLSMSIMSWIGVWPAALATSFAFEKVLNAVNHAYKNSNSHIAQFVRDFRNTWGPITDWQRILSIGMRSYSYVVYPYLRVLIEKAVRQKAFLSAYENGLNPFQKIMKDSELGKQMGLEKNEFLGLNNPTLGSEKMTTTVDRKVKIQSALQQQKLRAKSLAWTLASFAIAEKNGIDPATILQVSQQKVTTEQLRSIMDDPAKQREWELLTDEIHKELKSRNALTINQEIKDISPETIAEFYLVAQEAAKKINAQSALKQKVALRWKKFKTVPVNTLNFFLLQNGKSDALFLRSIITNNFVSSQVKQEFRNDHLMVVLLTAFVGARANLDNPESLTADRHGFLFTSHQHNYDMAINTFAHFFVSGASLALVFQKVRPQKETNYLPESDFTQTSDVRQEGFLSGLKSWISFGYNEVPNKPKGILNKTVGYMYNLATKADIGSVMVKRVGKRMTTIQAGMTMALVLRTMVGGQDLGTAMAAWSLMFIAGQWFYGWVWDPVQRGNQMIEERVERHNEDLRQARYNIETGLRTENMQMVEEGYDKMTELFEQHNSSDLKKLKTVLAENIDRIANPKENRSFGNEKEYYGLMARLAFANKTKNQTDFDQTITALRQVLVEKQGYDKDAVMKLNSQSLLEFSLSNPPVYTHANKFLSEFFTWNGAVWSTYLYIPLSIMLYSADSLSTGNILKWTMISTGLYLSAYAIFGKKPWLAYEKMYNNIQGRFKERAATKASPKSATTPAGASCSLLFL